MDKPYQTMTNEELLEAHTAWERNVEEAAGWSSAYFAATQVKLIVMESGKRGMGLVNRFTIQVGAQID